MPWVQIPPRAVFSLKAVLGVYICLVFIVMYMYIGRLLLMLTSDL